MEGLGMLLKDPCKLPEKPAGCIHCSLTATAIPWIPKNNDPTLNSKFQSTLGLGRRSWNTSG